MKFNFLFLLFFSSAILAEAIHPSPPDGWVELHQLDPIILTWARGNPEKKLKEVPSFAVQKFKRTEKFLTFIKEKPLDKDSCRDLKEGGWNQTWCLRPQSIMVILSRNEDSECDAIKKKLKTWVLTHD